MSRPGQIQDTSAQDQALHASPTARQRLRRWLLPAAGAAAVLAALAWTVSAWSGGGCSHDGSRIRVAEVVRGDLVRVYVPNLRSNDVSVIDPATMKVVDRFKVGASPQHVIPAWDLRTLWVANNAERQNSGSLTPIDPVTGKPGREVPVDDPLAARAALADALPVQEHRQRAGVARLPVRVVHR